MNAGHGAHGYAEGLRFGFAMLGTKMRSFEGSDEGIGGEGDCGTAQRACRGCTEYPQEGKMAAARFQYS